MNNQLNDTISHLIQQRNFDPTHELSLFIGQSLQLFVE